MSAAQEPADTAAEAAAAATGSAVIDCRRMGQALFQVRLDDLVTAVKLAGDADAARLPAESASLRWLTEAGTVAAPRVFDSAPGTLVIEWIPRGQPNADSARRFGRELAGLHMAGAPSFGAPPPGGPRQAWVGNAPMENTPGSDWPRWYAAHRVRPYVRLSQDAGTLAAGQVAVFDELCARIEELAGPAQAPARLHGDLWSGNLCWTGEKVALIDPAAHGGHRETDLAMLALFGAPHLEDILATYHEAAPLAEGWRDRVPLHQLFPLLVHTVLFGGSYAPAAVDAAQRALAVA
jgi:fructosamine-3-kinase